MRLSLVFRFEIEGGKKKERKKSVAVNVLTEKCLWQNIKKHNKIKKNVVITDLLVRFHTLIRLVDT